jgi:hypothetical protein
MLYFFMSLNGLLDERRLLLLVLLHLLHLLREVGLHLPAADQLLIGLLDAVV